MTSAPKEQRFQGGTLTELVIKQVKILQIVYYKENKEMKGRIMDNVPKLRWLGKSSLGK